MNTSLSDISSGIDYLGRLSCEEVDALWDNVQANGQISEDILYVGEQLSDAITQANNDITNAINFSTALNAMGFEKVATNIKSTGKEISNSVVITGDKIKSSIDVGQKEISKAIGNAGQSIMIGNIIAGQAISNALVGIGAVLQYRERMEQLRHKEKIQFEEENSDAGKSRRELKVASAILYAGDHIQAALHIKKSLELFPSSADTFRVTSIVESKAEKHDDSVISLMTALKLTESRNLFPTIYKLEHFEDANKLYSSIKVSIIAQLANELTLTNRISEALEYLTKGISEFKFDLDLHFQRIRVLSKSEHWEQYAGKYVSELIELSPKHFNLLYADIQLGEKHEALKQILRSIHSEKQKKICQKNKFLNIKSEGESNILKGISNLEKMSFLDLANFEECISRELMRF